MVLAEAGGGAAPDEVQAARRPAWGLGSGALVGTAAGLGRFGQGGWEVWLCVGACSGGLLLDVSRTACVYSEKRFKRRREGCNLVAKIEGRGSKIEWAVAKRRKIGEKTANLLAKKNTS